MKFHTSDIPEQLKQDLRDLTGRGHFGNGALDEGVFAAARVHFARIRAWDNRQATRRGWSRCAAAALLALAAVLAFQVGLPGTHVDSVAGDVNRDRRVDILDAFALARRIDAGDSLPAALDFDGDGRVSQRDVDALASTAVSLDIGAATNARAEAGVPGRSRS